MGRTLQTDNLSIIWTLKMLKGTAFLRFLLQEYRHDLDSGIILIAENDRRAWQIEKTFIDNLDIKSIPKLKQKIEMPLNYQMGTHVYSRSDKIGSIIDFLHQKDFLPVLIVGGIVPDGLHENAYTIKMNASDCEIKNFSSIYDGFKKYILNNFDYVLNQLENLKFESIINDYDIDIEYECFLHTSVAVGKIWKCYMYDIFNRHKYIKENEVDRKASIFFNEFVDSAAYAIELMERYDSFYDVQEAVRDCIIDYMKKHKDTTIKDISDVTGPSDLDRSILYDDRFYYINNRLFSDIFSPLLETISTVQLKKYMQDAGMLKCDNTAQGNYTHKVTLPFSTNGSTPYRYRCINIAKDSLKTYEGFLLEDYLDIYKDDEPDIETSTNKMEESDNKNSDR